MNTTIANFALLVCTVFASLVQGQVVNRHAILTPTNTLASGAQLISNVYEVTMQGTSGWQVLVTTQASWHFILSLNQGWGFHPSIPSAITITMNAPTLSTNLLLGFTTNNENYISLNIPVHTINAPQIFPQCNTMSAGIGDIAALPNYNRKCDIAGGSCSHWTSTPFNAAHLAITSPISITLENDPVNGALSIYLGTASFNSNANDRCQYAVMASNNGLKMYVGGDAVHDSFFVTSFDVVSTLFIPTTTTTTTTAAPMPIVPETTTATTVTTPPVPINIQTTTTATTTTTTTTSAAPVVQTAGPGQEFGAFGQLCRQATSNMMCQSSTDVISSQLTNGLLQCANPFDCCLCQSLQCGDITQGCRRFSAGPASVFGVQSIHIQGVQQGASIDCFGIESCAYSHIDGENIVSINAGNSYSMRYAKVSITDPSKGFTLQCVGDYSCKGMQLLIEISGPPQGYACNPQYLAKTLEWEHISCIGVSSCEDIHITIDNQGCNIVEISGIECGQDTSCNNATFDFKGDIVIGECSLAGAANSIRGINKCFENLEYLSCSEPNACQGAVRTLINPLPGFMMTCTLAGSCANVHLTFVFDGTSTQAIDYLDGFKFSAQAAAYGATIVFENTQPGVFLEIERVECTSIDSCADVTFILGENVQIAEFSCNSGACDGCTIMRDTASLAIPCDPNSPYVYPQQV